MSLTTPFRPRTFLLWSGVRALAGLGALRLLPAAGDAPDVPLAELVMPHVPNGGHVALRPVARRGRWSAMTMTAAGEPHALVKVAVSDEAVAALAAEARMQAQLAARVQPPLRVPEVLVAEPHLLVFRAVVAQPRLRSWRLPEQVATGLGAMTRAGLTHGDFAPWNLLRTSDGWFVIDWESARLTCEPWVDLWHFVVQSHALVQHPTTRTILEGLNDHGWLGRAVRAYAKAAEVGIAGAVEVLRSHIEWLLTEYDPAERRTAAALPRASALLAAVQAAGPAR